jgi:4-hydroxymandelate oxidase
MFVGPRGRGAVVDLAALEERARVVLGRAAYDFVAGGADEEETLADNIAAWSRLRVRPRVLRDVRLVSTGVRVLGTPLASPLLVAPIGFQRLAHPDGEEATTRGARSAGALMVAPTRSSVTFERIGEAASGPWWCQVYLLRDRGWTEALVDRAVGAGATALILTVDTPFLGRKRRDERNAFSFPEGVTVANLPDEGGAADVAQRPEGARQSPAVTFDDLSWLEGTWGLPVVAKGVLRGDDAVACVEAGASAVVVSNHGGRQLDGSVSTAEALDEVVSAVDGRAEVYVDGGIRRGSDVLKALALGAQAVLVGRPVMWGLACGGEKGVAGVLGQLREELALAMALCGVPEVADVTPDLLAPAPTISVASSSGRARPSRPATGEGGGVSPAPGSTFPPMAPGTASLGDDLPEPAGRQQPPTEALTPPDGLDGATAPASEADGEDRPDGEMTEATGPLA